MANEEHSVSPHIHCNMTCLLYVHKIDLWDSKLNYYNLRYYFKQEEFI